MTERGVRRLISITVLGAGDSMRHATFVYRYIIGPFVLGNVLEDKNRQKDEIRRSELDWIMIRPAMLTDDPARNSYRILTDQPGVVSEITRADLAAFALAQIESERYLREAVTIGY